MGIFSSIGNAISAGFNALDKTFTAVCDTVKTIGTQVAAFAHTIKPVLGPILMTIGQVIPHPAVKAVASFANVLLHALSIFHPDENVQDMGDRALQAAAEGITTDKFENFDDYMAALRGFDINPELSEKYSPAEKIVAGLGIATVGIEDKFNAEPGSLSNIWLLPIANFEYFTPDRVKSLLESGKIIGDVSAYLEKRMGGEEASEFRKNLEITPEGKPMNDTELGQLYDALDSARTEWAELNKQLKDSE